MSYDKKIYSSAVIAIVGVALMATSSSAAVLTFTDLASWQAAVSSSALEDFESVAADDDFTGSSTTVGALGLSSVEESTFSNNALVDQNSDGFESGSDFNGSNAHVSLRFVSHDPTDTATVTLPAGQSAFALDYNNYDNQGDTADLSFAGTNGGALVTFAPSTGFFGVVDTGAGASITSFTIAGGDPSVGSGSSTFISFDDVRYGVAAIPEPASLALLGVAGIAVLGMRRKEM